MQCRITERCRGGFPFVSCFKLSELFEFSSSMTDTLTLLYPTSNKVNGGEKSVPAAIFPSDTYIKFLKLLFFLKFRNPKLQFQLYQASISRGQPNSRDLNKTPNSTDSQLKRAITKQIRIQSWKPYKAQFNPEETSLIFKSTTTT